MDRRTLALAVMLAAAALASGCMHAQLQESREFATAIGRNESIVLLSKPHVEGAGTEEDFTQCVSDDLKQSSHGKDGVKIHDHEQFVDALFPWFEPSTAPARPEALAALFDKPGVAKRIADSGVRYIVWLDGDTHKTDGGGSLACGAAPGAAGCIGFGWWEKESNYVASVWDLKETRSVGTLATNVTGTSAIVGAIVPLPFIARVQGAACDRMASQLRDFLQGADLAHGSAQ